MVFRSDFLENISGTLSQAASSFAPSITRFGGNLAGNLGSVSQVFGQIGSIRDGFSGLSDISNLFNQFGVEVQSGFNTGASTIFGGGAGFASSSTGATAGDSRARLSAKSAYTTAFSGPGAILQPTNGILFPYTPNISVSHQVEYSSYEVVHQNYQQNAYSKTRNPAIQVTGVFASQTPEEAEYTIGAMHFLRVASKMNFGAGSSNPGTPPPVLEFSAYGKYNFSRVPVLIGSFNFIYEDGVDYVSIGGGDSTLQIPTIMTIAIDLLPQFSPARQNQFSIEGFANGSLYSQGFI